MSLLEELLELDILANQALGGRRETISARLGRRVFNGSATPKELGLCHLLDLVEPEHCLKSYARSFDRPRQKRRSSAESESTLIEETYAILGVR